MLLQTVSNHPVHILNKYGNFSPSSFIPFCSFGDEFIGAKINQFPIPVCDIFKPKHYFDQLCYETNLQELKSGTKLGNQLKMGLTLVLDFNEERQLDNEIGSAHKSHVKKKEGNGNSFSMFVDTISKKLKKNYTLNFPIFRSCGNC